MKQSTPTHTEESHGCRYELYHLKKGEGILDNTTTSGRHLHGPSSILRVWYPDGGCSTTEYDYEPTRVIGDYFEKLLTPNGLIC